MPLFYQHNINDAAELAVWHITEPEDYFTREVQLQYTIPNPQKRLQHLAGRYLLKILDEGFPLHEIEISESRKPLLKDGSRHFSISHCGDYAAAVLSEGSLAGIDVEKITPKIEVVKTKFMGEGELAILPSHDPEIITLCWSAKEAVYKWYGLGLLSFKNHIVITDIHVWDEVGIVHVNFRMGSPRDLKIQFRFFNGICLAWMVG